jgi:hypothetical protein
MYALMFLHITLLPEGLITHITGKWKLPSMYELMSLEYTMPSEWLITHITEKQPLPSTYAGMYAHMCLQIRMLTE